MWFERQAPGAEKISELQKEIKRLQQEHRDAESKLKALCESRVKASTSFIAEMHPRLKVRNLIRYSDRVSLDRDLFILEKALNGKVPNLMQVRTGNYQHKHNS